MTLSHAAITCEDRYTVVNGLRFHYRVVGDVDAPPILVLHGIMGHSREWDALVDSLASTWRVFAIDQRGHGETEWATEYSPAVMADDVIRFVEREELAPVPIVGHSMGGMAAMLAAVGRPELVEQLPVVDVGPTTVRGDLAASLQRFVEALASASYDTVDQATAEWSGNPFARPHLVRHFVVHNLIARDDGKLAWRFDGQGLRHFFANVNETELWCAVDSIRCPVIVIRGEHSPALPPATADEMIRRLVVGRPGVVPHAAHDLGVEQPETVARLAESFFRPPAPRRDDP
jgi:esterase